VNSGKVCISISASTASEMLAAATRAQAEADIIELRFDSLRPDELPLAVVMTREASLLKPVIATFRSPEQGGLRTDLTRQERLEFWSELGDAAWARDLEEDIVADAGRGTTIVTFHRFSGKAETLETLERLSNTDADILKIAVATEDIGDAIPIWSTLTRPLPDGRQIVPIAMGEAGKWTRILGLAHGAFMTYASLDTGSETAGGQLTAHDLLNVYRVKDLDADTKVYGVIGDPVSSSLSPFMHNAAFAEAGENAVFLPLEVKDLDAFMRRMVLPSTREVELNFGGFAVTMPHKQAIKKYLTSIDPVAEAIGAVNTVKLEGDQLTGYNTDAPGFIAPLKKRIPDLKDARVVVLGSGGAARAVIYALRQENADVTVLARDANKAKLLADEFRVTYSSPPYEGGVADAASAADGVVLSAAGDKFDIVVNTTPLGMRGLNADKTPITADQLSGVRFVYDLVTRSDDTPLLLEATKAGIPCIGGIEMLVSQGIKQFEIWTGREAPADLMRQSAVERLM
jgi:3-dehydroquinate dehydratase/shikimate dehydrogenase